MSQLEWLSYSPQPCSVPKLMITVVVMMMTIIALSLVMSAKTPTSLLTLALMTVSV